MTSTQNLAVVERSRQELSRPMSAAEVKAQVNLIQEVLSEVMIQGTHFGTIPGTQKPTLYKAGSEQILTTFRLGVEPEVIDLSTSDEVRYRVNAHIYIQATGQRIGTGVGEASTNEEKYRFRSAVCQEEFDETAEDRRRKKWAKGQGGKTYQVMQVRTNPSDLANTVLKMAKKRAQIDATLTATAASDVFAQDLEDLPEEMRDASEEAPARKEPQRKEQPPASSPTSTARIAVTGHKAEEKTGPNGPWTKHVFKAEDGKTYSTGKADMAQVLIDAQEAGQQLDVTFLETKYGRELQKAAAVERQPGDEA